MWIDEHPEGVVGEAVFVHDRCGGGWVEWLASVSDTEVVINSTDSEEKWETFDRNTWENVSEIYKSTKTKRKRFWLSKASPEDVEYELKNRLLDKIGPLEKLDRATLERIAELVTENETNNDDRSVLP